MTKHRLGIDRLTLEFDEAHMSGVACNLDSPGFHALCKATEEIVGHVKPYSITGSLPLIRELQVIHSLALRTKKFYLLYLDTSLYVYHLRNGSTSIYPFTSLGIKAFKRNFTASTSEGFLLPRNLRLLK